MSSGLYEVGNVGPDASVSQGENITNFSFAFPEVERVHPIRVPVPSVQAPVDYIDRPELTQCLLGYLTEIARLDVLEEEENDEPDLPLTGRERRKSLRASLLLSVRYLSLNRQHLFARLGAIAEDALVSPKMAATLWGTDEQIAFRHLQYLSGAGILKAQDNAYRMHDLMHDLARELLASDDCGARAGYTRSRSEPTRGFTTTARQLSR